MPGYDTVTAGVASTCPGAVNWQRRSVVEFGARVLERRDLEIKEPFRLHMQHLRLDQDGRRRADWLSVEASLPKVLWGENVDELVDPFHAAKALALMSERVGQEVGERVDLFSWNAQRWDVTHNRELADQRRVQVALAALAQVKYRGRRPVIGEAGSVTWPGKRGGFTRGAYSKLDESQLAAADGRLRVEVRAWGQKAIRRAWGMPPEYVGPGGSAPIAVGDLLSPMADRAMGRALAWLDGAVDHVLEVVPVNGLEALAKFEALGRRPSFPPRMMGYVALVQLGGWQLVESMVSRQAAWSIRKDFAAAGVDPMQVELPRSVFDELSAELDKLQDPLESRATVEEALQEGLDHLAELEGPDLGDALLELAEDGGHRERRAS